MIKYHDSDNLWKKEFVSAYSSRGISVFPWWEGTAASWRCKKLRDHIINYKQEEEQTINPLEACSQCCTSSSKAALEPPQTVPPLGDQVVKEVSP